MAALQTPLTLATLRAYVRNLILERSGDNGLVTDAELNDLCNLGARTVWLRIATRYPDVFAQRSASSVVVPTTCIVPFSSISTGANIFRVMCVRAGATGAAESAMELINPIDRVSSRHVYEPASPAPALPYRYFVEGASVVFTPITAGTFDARFTWAQMPLDMTLDADQLWGGLQPMYHDTVALLTAQLAVNKDAPQAQSSIFVFLDSILQENYGAQNPYESNPRETRP